MKFPTQFTQKITIFSSAGTKVECVDKTTGEKFLASGRRYLYKQVYESEGEHKGRRNLVIYDTEDVYEKIQSFKDDTDIYKIVSKYFNGDVTALDKNKGFYADLTEIPKDIHEWQNRISEGQNIFAGLPTDFKEKFGNDINRFMTSLYDKSFEGKFNDYVKSKFVNNSNMAIVNNSYINDNKSVSNKVDGGVKNE